MLITGLSPVEMHESFCAETFWSTEEKWKDRWTGTEKETTTAQKALVVGKMVNVLSQLCISSQISDAISSWNSRKLTLKLFTRTNKSVVNSWNSKPIIGTRPEIVRWFNLFIRWFNFCSRIFHYPTKLRSQNIARRDHENHQGSFLRKNDVHSMVKKSSF